MTPPSQPLVQEVYSRENEYLRSHLRQREESAATFDYAHHWYALAEILGNDEELLAACAKAAGRKLETPEDVQECGAELWVKLPPAVQADAQQELENTWDVDDANAPTERHMSLRNSKKVLPSTTWLVHFSDHAAAIARDGFKVGFDDAHRLGLTSHFSADAYEKSGVGYNFAFLVGSPEAKDGFGSNWRGGMPKYGRNAVVFQASGVAVDHHGDEEQQIIFYGARINPKNIVFLRNEGDGNWAIPDPRTNRIIYQGEGESCARWLTQHFAQYQQRFTAAPAAYDSQRMQLTEAVLQKAVARYCRQHQDEIRRGTLTPAMLRECILSGINAIFGQRGPGPLPGADPLAANGSDPDLGPDSDLLQEKNVPNNPGLWSNCKAAAKRKFDVYPSAYANGYAAKQYKAKGGTWKKAKSMHEDHPLPPTAAHPAGPGSGAASDQNLLDEASLLEKNSHGGLDKWFKEKWVDISKKDADGKHPSCGREDTSKGGYPKCRKSAVAAQMSSKEVKNSVARKRQAEKEGAAGKRSPNVAH